jgi:hypothetical protein
MLSSARAADFTPPLKWVMSFSLQWGWIFIGAFELSCLLSLGVYDAYRQNEALELLSGGGNSLGVSRHSLTTKYR